MRGKLLVGVLATCMLASGLGAGAASAAKIPVEICALARCGPMLQIKAGARIAPQALPPRRREPIGFSFEISASAADGSHPSALREMNWLLDRDFRIDARGLPVCRRAGISPRDRQPLKTLMRECRPALVGSGRAELQVKFGDRPPIPASSPVLVVNDGIRSGVASLFAVLRATVPVPAHIVVSLEFSRISKGRFGWRMQAEVPQIVGGYGSLTRFEVDLKRSFLRAGKRRSLLSARCTDGRLFARMLQADFFNEANLPGVQPRTTLKGNLVVPCTPRR